MFANDDAAAKARPAPDANGGRQSESRTITPALFRNCRGSYARIVLPVGPLPVSKSFCDKNAQAVTVTIRIGSRTSSPIFHIIDTCLNMGGIMCEIEA